MNRMKNILAVIILLVFGAQAYGHINPDLARRVKDGNFTGTRADCQPAEKQIDLDINNVRARLLTGGDLWWDKSNGRYIVPKPAPGFDEVSSLFAGAVWIGGVDRAGNIKLAASDYAQGNSTDFYPGPLDDLGQTEQAICNQWDEFFQVYGEDVRKHAAYTQAGPIGCDTIVDGVKYWPGKGNPFFAEKYGFELPEQSLAPFWDEDLDGIYNPCVGDFPIVDIRGCEPETRSQALELLPDEMIYWIYNDNGGPHRLSRASAIQMEVRVQAFAYATNDEINDMTFYRYKLVNRAEDAIGDCYFAMWIDPDLGCHTDDYIGCDVERSLMYVYNEDQQDGTTGCACEGGVNTYCEEIPILGVDYFRGPRRPYRFVRDANGNPTFDNEGNKIIQALDINDPDINQAQDTLVELGMTSFIYYNNGGIGDPDPRTTDPQNGPEYYNYLRGFWRDGTPFTYGGTAFNPESNDTTKYVFPDAPNVDGWSMCTEDLPYGDRRTAQATGPLLLTPDATNELIIGVPFVPDIAHPCPDISRLLFADDIAQALFDNCFDITDGPDAPDMYGIELDRQLILLLSNDSLEIESNNAKEQYSEVDLNAPEGVEDNEYKFEGYKIYQLADANVSPQELDQIERARLVRQVDLQNGVSEIYNWYPQPNPDPENMEILFYPELEVSGADQGIVHSFNILEDQFASGQDRRLINNKNYHFMVIAYAHNNYGFYDPQDNVGQRRPYLEGRQNVKVYTFTPRPLAYNELNAAYGEQAVVTRLEGQGTGLNVLDIQPQMYDLIINGQDEGRIVYEAGNAPIEVKIIDPLRIEDGEYQLRIIGDYIESNSNPRLAPGAKWTLTDVSSGQTITSERTIDEFNEQLIYQKGFSVTIVQPGEPGEGFNEANGFLGQFIEYDDNTEDDWLGFVSPAGGVALSDGNPNTNDPTLFAYAQADNPMDPNQYITSNSNYFLPLFLARWNLRQNPDPDQPGLIPNLSPGWQELQGFTEETGLALKNLNNVDVVFTSDKSKWSRCPVVETANSRYANNYGTIGNANQFDLRESPSVDKEGNPDNTGNGMGWFPGYAIDVETGERLNIFFGENSAFREEIDNQLPLPGVANNGDDMIFNPKPELLPGGVETANLNSDPIVLYGGGQHFIYVTRQVYDEGASIAEGLREQSLDKDRAISMITWTAWPLPSSPLTSVSEGLIPSDVIVKLRVTNPYNKETRPVSPLNGTSFETVGDLPLYNISFSGKAMTERIEEDPNNLLSEVRAVPNPYYAYSSYENSQFAKRVKITNLPARAIVTIYSLDGKFIRQLNRDEVPSVNSGSNPATSSNQVFPDLEWDLNNSKGIPVASGVYIFHIEAPDLGAETSIKWFGVNRKFDPSGL